MVDRYTKVVLTIIAVGLWVQVGLQINPVKDAAAELNSYETRLLELIKSNLDSIDENTRKSKNYLEEISCNSY